MPHYPDIIHNTTEWYEARAGLATTSAFGKILTPSGERSKTRNEYANQIVAELILGKSVERDFNSYAMEWGNTHEPDAASMYQFETGMDLVHGSFWTNEEMTAGTSPDCIALEGMEQKGLVEIKCPENPTIHVGFLLLQKINMIYKPQLFGQMLITGFDWVDWYSYYPGMPAVRIRTSKYDDIEYFGKLERALIEFEQLVQQKLLRLQDLGHIDEIPKKILNAGRQATLNDPAQDILMAG